MSNSRIGFIGAGNMARAIISGLLDSGYSGELIHATTLHPENLEDLAAKGVHTGADNSELVKQCDVVVFAVKPQKIEHVVRDLREELASHQPLVISVAAGITAAALCRWASCDLALVRCMPNTPALVGKGASGLFANDQTRTEQKQLAEQILSAVGITIWVDKEEQIDAVTAVSGSGPAYYFLMMEAMIDAAQKLGLPAEQAQQLVLQTALGAATMASTSEHDAAELRRRVTSPKGTTEQAILSFQREGFESIVEHAMEACKNRAGTLAKELCKL